MGRAGALPTVSSSTSTMRRSRLSVTPVRQSRDSARRSRGLRTPACRTRTSRARRGHTQSRRRALQPRLWHRSAVRWSRSLRCCAVRFQQPSSCLSCAGAASVRTRDWRSREDLPTRVAGGSPSRNRTIVSGSAERHVQPGCNGPSPSSGPPASRGAVRAEPHAEHARPHERDADLVAMVRDRRAGAADRVDLGARRDVAHARGRHRQSQGERNLSASEPGVVG